MRNSPPVKNEALVILAGAVLMGGLTLLAAPILTKKALLLAALPFAALLLLVMVLNVRHMFIFMLMTRAFMDPILDLTKMGGEGGSGAGAILNIFVIAMTVVMILKKPEVLKDKRVVIAWACYLGMSTLSIAFAPQRFQAARMLVSLLTYFSFFLAPFFIIRSEEDKKFWIKVILIGSIIPLVCAHLGLVFPNSLLVKFGRVRSTFTHPNILAFYALFLAVLILYSLRTNIFRMNLFKRLFMWFYLADVVLVLIVTQTRSAWISFVFIILLYGLMKERKILIVFLLGLAVVFVTPPVQKRLEDLKQSEASAHRNTRTAKLNSMAWRVRLWKSAVPSIKKKFVQGHGLASFDYLSQYFSPSGQGVMVAAHNVYVQILFEIGILGLLSYLAVYYYLLKTFWRRYRYGSDMISRESILVFCYLIGYLITSYSDNLLGYLSFNWYYWFFIGMMLKMGDYYTYPAARVPNMAPGRAEAPS